MSNRCYMSKGEERKYWSRPPSPLESSHLWPNDLHSLWNRVDNSLLDMECPLELAWTPKEEESLKSCSPMSKTIAKEKNERALKSNSNRDGCINSSSPLKSPEVTHAPVWLKLHHHEIRNTWADSRGVLSHKTWISWEKKVSSVGQSWNEVVETRKQI